MIDGTEQTIALPQLERVILRNFSLYSRVRTVDIPLTADVFCLAGANGLGKSTFLSALTFGMTGAIAKPDLSFLRASDYYKEVLSYSGRFFEGRISAVDHDLAEVELHMRVRERRYVLVRGMFAPEGLRALQIEGPEGAEDYSGPEFQEEERHDHYVQAILRDTGLRTFAQLVFLQLFVLTFDERRRLLFWADRVTEQALFLAFGLSAEVASRAEALQRTYDSAESRARNLQWQATGTRRKLNALTDAVAGASDANTTEVDLQAEHRRLTEASDSAVEELRQSETAWRNADLQLAEIIASIRAAQAEYQSTYLERLRAGTAPRDHPAIVETLAEERCAVCGASGAGVSAAVQAALDAEQCPLCESVLSAPGELAESPADRRLHELSELIAALEEEQSAVEEAAKRARERIDAADTDAREVSRSLQEFRAANTDALLSLTSEEALVGSAADGLRQQISDLLEQKDAELSRRNDARAQLDELREQLTMRFAEMEHEFVPLFQDLAFEFLGMPLQVNLEKKGAHVALQLALAGSERPEPEDLSESQRFFLDIALRMALAQKMSTAGHPATLFIDTPEGSLDIAYESRAGRMFAKFATGGNKLVMTANINTSQLLQELAGACGQEGMQLVRMTDWAELSDVQRDAEELFDLAYSDIEKRLHGAAR